MNLERLNSRRFLTIFSGAFIGLFLSKGSALLPGFALDDYLAGSRDEYYSFIPFVISQGRFTQAAILEVFKALDLVSIQVVWPSLVLAMVAIAVAATLGIEYTTRGTGSVATLAAIAAVVGAYPYFTEYFLWRSAAVVILLQQVFLAVALWLISARCDRTRKRWLCAAAAALMVALATGIYQQSIAVYGVFVVGRLGFDIARSPQRLAIRRSLEENLSGIASMVGGAVFYLMGVLASQSASPEAGDTDPRSELLDIGSAPQRLAQIRALVGTIVWREEVVLSWQVKAALLAAGAILLIRASRGWRRPVVWILLALTSLAFAIVFVAISQSWWPVPRSLFVVSYAYGVTVAVLAGWVERRTPMAAALLLAGAIGSVLHSSAILADQERVNRWDAHQVDVIASALMAADVAPGTRVVLASPSYTYAEGPDTVFGDANISALAVPWTAGWLFREQTGNTWDVSVGEAREYGCIESWPAAGSILVTEDLAVVCMGP